MRKKKVQEKFFTEKDITKAYNILSLKEKIQISNAALNLSQKNKDWDNKKIDFALYFDNLAAAMGLQKIEDKKYKLK